MISAKRNINKEIISLFSGQSSVLTVRKLYVQLTGSYSLGLVLNQCVYWSNKSECKDDWFHKTYEEWFKEIHMPPRTLRRRFEILEKAGWLSTKVKKVRGLNIKHFKPNMDNIIDSIARILDTESPNRPDVDSGANNDQNTCTKVVPTGHSGRLESAKLADSTIYTDEYLQMSVGANAQQHTRSSISQDKKTKTEDEAFNDQDLRNFFSAKFAGLTISYEELFKDCTSYYGSKGQWVTNKKWRQWIEREKLENYAKNTAPSEIDISKETEQERRNRQFVENEHFKESEGTGYKSPFLENERRREITEINEDGTPYKSPHL
ncbi:MAG TPA: hypothetical protein VNU45_09215 [Rummeliibacillus sp.]|nr:hypothetical protein [Rummeliibacillus sp.]